MPDVFRKLFSKLNRSFAENTSPRRRPLHVPIKISIKPDVITGKLIEAKREMLSISGETYDLSKTGVAFIVSAIRLREYYLVGENRPLYAELDLPNGKIQMQLVGVRYEQTGIHDSVVSYIIGARIAKIEPLEMEIYEEYLRLGDKLKKGKQKLSLGTDG
jgi:hypothetical protein